MARKTEVVSAPSWCGRDQGKTFVITEMSAVVAEKWALAMFIALKGTSAAIPYEVERLGMIGVAVATINAFLAADVDRAKLDPLLDQMLTCITRIRDLKAPNVVTPLRLELDDIEEVATLAWLRSEVLRVHTGFPVAESLSRLISAIQSPAPSNTRTSRRTSASRSHQAAQPTPN
jgi:hypothetical protein